MKSSVFIGLLFLVLNGVTAQAPPPVNPLPMDLAFDSKKLEQLEFDAYSGKNRAAALLASRATLLLGDKTLQLHWLTVGVIHGDYLAFLNYAPFIDSQYNDRLRTARIRFVYIYWRKHSSKWTTETKQEAIKQYRSYGIELY